MGGFGGEIFGENLKTSEFFFLFFLTITPVLRIFKKIPVFLSPFLNNLDFVGFNFGELFRRDLAPPNVAVFCLMRLYRVSPCVSY